MDEVGSAVPNTFPGCHLFLRALASEANETPITMLATFVLMLTAGSGAQVAMTCAMSCDAYGLEQLGDKKLAETTQTTTLRTPRRKQSSMLVRTHTSRRAVPRTVPHALHSSTCPARCTR